MTKSLPVPHVGSHDANAPANDVPTDASAASERFVEERLLGQGAMGVVHLVRDRETGEQLARKQLLRVDAKGVLRLKREFRSLADVSHPNLVKLYELGRERDVWFLTMEYVPGVDLKAYLDLTPANRSDDPATRTASASGEQDTAEPVAREQRVAHPTLQLRAAPQLSKVLAAFHQLALGIDALHRARVLHRDLKPSNVLVADERVIVLDFGLARRLDEGALTVTEEGMVAGTPAYMAPEQVRGLALTEASDWYAFGCMLYEALTAELPHDGSLYEILEGKLECDPLPPIAINPALPPNLSALCMSLLSRSPQARPNGAEVLAQLEPARPELPGSAQELQTSLLEPQTVLQTGPAPLYGREPQLAALLAAKQRSEAGHTTVVHVRGVSGSGKSTLVETFLDQIESTASPQTLQPTLVLRSRCYEREAMPFKALDGVMDVLSRHFLRFDDIEVSHRLPSDIVALAKLFPVLERVRVVERLARDRHAHSDVVSDRQRAELALHDLFARLSAHSPLVIWIDDLQWGDLDSAGVLKSWLQRTTALPILVLLSYRADEVETSECLRFMLGTDAGVELVDVPPLAAEDVAAICRDRLAGPADREALIARIVNESQGSPFLAAQLATLAQARLARGDHDVDVGSIDGLVTQTKTLLTPEAQHLLTVLAVAGRPIPPKLLLRAANLRKGSRDLHELRRMQLVRTRDVAGVRLLEVYHDRVGEAVRLALDPEQSQRIHADLLAAVSFSGRADPDWLHALALGARESAAALRYGLAAAERATAALAFERAAELYRSCLALCDESRRVELLRKQAAVLGWCGRGALAADAYLAASQLSTGAEALQLLRLSTSNLLRCGRFAEGEAMLQRVLAALNEKIPTSTAGLTAAIVWERLRLGTRGMHFTARPANEVDPALLMRIDTFDGLRLDSVSVDPLRAYLFLMRLTRWALDAGEPMRVLRALGANCYSEAVSGTPRAAERADQLLLQMGALEQQIGTPEARVEVCVIRALSFWMLGRADAVLAPALEAEQLLSKLGPSEAGTDYLMRRATRAARIGALFELAEYGAFASELQAELEHVRSIDHRAAVLQLALNETLLDELLDRGEHVRARLMRQRSELPAVDFSVYHALHMIAVCRAGVLSGEPSWSLELLEQDWPRFLRSPLRTAGNIRLHAQDTRLHLLVTHHILTARSVKNVPSEIRSELRALAAIDARSKVFAQYSAARLALAAGDRPRAIELMRSATEQPMTGTRYDRMRLALGLIMGGQEGEAVRAESERVLRERGLSQVTGCLRADLPEFFMSGWR